MANKTLPQGYKDSPLGIIPKEWEVKRLEDIADITSGTTPLRANSEYYNNGVIPWVKTTDLNNGTLYETEEKVSKEAVEKTSLRILPKGTVVVAMYGGFRQIGRTALLGIDATINQALSALMCKSSVESPFVLAWLNYRVNYWKRLAASSRKDPNITGNEVAKFPILIPSKEEQGCIVEVLGLWDTAIEKQSELIEKLKLRKRALMQQLLTGKKRLPGFSGEWKKAKLGDVSNFLRNNTLSREQLNDDYGVINNIHYGDVLIKYPSIIDCRKEKLQYINDGVSILTDYVENGDVIMSDTAEDETVGRVCEIQNVGNKKILAGLHTMLIRPHDKLFAPYYLGYYLNSEAYHKQLIPLIQGIKVCSIGKVAVQNTILRIPSLEEQRIIASVFVQADKEIELANEKLSDLQSQKRGLMQQLLTGKKRIF